MRNCKDVFFSTLDGDNIDQSTKDLLCAATLEYSGLLLISGSRSLLADIAQHIYASVKIRPRCLLVSTGTVLATVEHFLEHAYLPVDIDRRFIKFDLQTGLTTEVPQLRATDFITDRENRTHYINKMQGLHPIVKHTVEAACAQHSELNRYISRLLIGYSFLSENLLREKSLSTDLDGLQLDELKAFVDLISSLKTTFSIFQADIDSLISYCKNLLIVCPSSASDLSNTHATAALQNGFPCVYKVMSVLHFLGYEVSMHRQLYNKAFMHIFRAYECYASGALFLHNAVIGNVTNSKGTFPDIYLLDAKRISGFGKVFDGIGKHFDLEHTKEYKTCKFYISLRNKFHYTHGDIKPSKMLILEFSRTVLRQILKIEKASNQKIFQWKNIYKQTKNNLLRNGSHEVPRAITRHLGIPPVITFLEC